MTFPNDKLKQTAVYWANPVDDGYGGLSWDAPEEIDCRWINTNEIVKANNGEEFVCRASVQVSQDLDENGLLYLGDLDDLDSDDPADPDTIAGVYRIRKFDKTPTINGTAYYREAWI